eukprot:GFUD01082924.1.p1 GENE.GFUD01082924.1~~GFUD01082924.1.p1  ORF type:complete len:100 (-),score=22.76 GFUD01082924.1:123-422(-)
MILKEPLLNMDGACPSDICPCYGPMVRINEQPLLYDIVEDPTESNEIESSSQIYQEVSKIMIKDLREFREDIETTKMKSQFQEMLKILPMPWLQPYLEK